MRDDYARREIAFLQAGREVTRTSVSEKASRSEVARLESELEALRKAFNNLMELVVAKQHLVNLDQFGGPHTLDVQRSAVEMK